MSQSTYSRTDLESLLECVWDDRFLFRVSPEQEIKPQTDPATGGTRMAEVADTRLAWRRAGLAPEQRDLLEARYLYGYGLDGISTVFRHPNVSYTGRLIDWSLDTLLAYMNGVTR